MNINKGLKQKNKLAKEINLNWGRIKLYNAKRVDSKNTYNTQELFSKVVADIEGLVEVKTKIAKANTDVYTKIYRMSELKSIIAHLKGVQVITEPELIGYGEAQKEVEYTNGMDNIFMDEQIAKYEQEIQDLQDELDKFNFNTEI